MRGVDAAVLAATWNSLGTNLFCPLQGAPLAIEYVDWIIRAKLPLEPTERFALAIMAFHANIKTGGIAYPSMATLGAEIGVSERQAKRIVHALIDKDWLAPVSTQKGGRAKSVRYQINLAKVRQTLQNHDTHVTVSDPTKGDTHVMVSKPERVTSKAGKGDMQDRNHDMQGKETVTPMSPKPEVEPLRTGIEPVPDREPPPPGIFERLRQVTKGMTIEPERKREKPPTASPDDSPIETDDSIIERREQARARQLAIVHAATKGAK